MADSVFTNADGFVPQAVVPTIENYVRNNLALFQTGALLDVTSSVGWNMGGTSITRPRFAKNQIAAKDLDTTATTSNDTQKPSMDYETILLASKIIPLQLTGTSLEDVFNNPSVYNLIVNSIKHEVATCIDKTGITHKPVATDYGAEGTALVYDATAQTTKTLTYDNIAEAQFQWGDKAAIPAVLLAHSKCVKDLLKTSDMKNIKLGEVIISGVKYLTVLGMPIVPTDQITLADGVYTNLLIKIGGLGYAAKRPLTINPVYKGNDVWQVDFTWRFATMRNPILGVDSCVRLLTN